MKCRLAVVLFVCAVVLGCGKTNDPPAGMAGPGYSPHDKHHSVVDRETNKSKDPNRNP